MVYNCDIILLEVIVPVIVTITMRSSLRVTVSIAFQVVRGIVGAPTVQVVVVPVVS